MFPPSQWRHLLSQWAQFISLHCWFLHLHPKSKLLRDLRIWSEPVSSSLDNLNHFYAFEYHLYPDNSINLHLWYSLLWTWDFYIQPLTIHPHLNFTDIPNRACPKIKLIFPAQSDTITHTITNPETPWSSLIPPFLSLHSIESICKHYLNISQIHPLFSIFTATNQSPLSPLREVSLQPLLPWWPPPIHSW